METWEVKSRRKGCPDEGDKFFCYFQQGLLLLAWPFVSDLIGQSPISPGRTHSHSLRQSVKCSANLFWLLSVLITRIFSVIDGLGQKFPSSTFRGGDCRELSYSAGRPGWLDCNCKQCWHFVLSTKVMSHVLIILSNLFTRPNSGRNSTLLHLVWASQSYLVADLAWTRHRLRLQDSKTRMFWTARLQSCPARTKTAPKSFESCWMQADLTGRGPVNWLCFSWSSEEVISSWSARLGGNTAIRPACESTSHSKV